MNILTCWYCGHEIPSSVAYHSQRSFHPDCLIKFQTERDKQLEDYLRLKMKVMFERALREMEKQDDVYVTKYYDEAQLVREMALNNVNKFQSSDEMMAAMELVRKRVKTKVQYHIGHRRVDFLLPELHVALEIDGALHRFKINKDSQREIEIMDDLKKLGGNWEIIRVPTDLIEKNLTKLVPAIKALYKVRQELRAKNGGFLPSYWSRTNRIAQIDALMGVKDKSKASLNDYHDTHPQEL